MDDYNDWGLICRYHIETNTVHHVAGDLTVSTACETGDVDSIALGSSLKGITVGPSGSIYFSDTQGDCLRRIGLDGTVEKIAGGGSVNPVDGMDARSARLLTPKGVFVTDSGAVYLADSDLNQVLRIATDGTITVVTDLFEPRDVVVSDEGYIYVTNINNVYRVSPSGEQDIVMGRTGYVWQEYASSTYVYTPNLVEIELSPDHTEQNPSILVGTVGYNSNSGHRVYRLGSPYSYYDEGYHYVPSSDGSYYYTFDEEGRHLFTKQLLTGTTVWTFGYDSNGRLSSLRDRMGQVTTIEHDIDGNITGIVTPNNSRTEITTDSNGLISSVTSPTSKTYNMVYEQTDLLTFLRDPANNEHSYEYNDDGRLVADTRPNSGTISLARTGNSQNYTVTKTSPEGRVTTYSFITDSANNGGIKTISYSDGSQVTIQYEGAGSRTVTYPSGIEHEMVYAPDPRFGMQLPYAAESTITYPSGESFTTETEREVELENAGAVFDMVTVTDTIVEAGIRSLTVVQNAAQRTVTQTTGEGRQVVTSFDELGRVSGVERIEGDVTDSNLAALSFTYEEDTGLVSRVQRGEQYFEYGYDSQGRVISRTDAMGRTVDYAYDDDNLISQLTLADGSTQYEYGYDDLGRRTSYMMPNGGAHTLNYTFDDNLGEYAAPATSNPLSKSYDLDSRITEASHPTGRSIQYSRNGQHRLETVSYDEGEVSVTFSGVSTDVEPETMTVTPVDSDATAQTLTFGRDGSRLTTLTGSGAVPFEASFEYSPLGSVDALTFSIDGYSYSATMSHDSDGYQTSEDDITQDRSGPKGAPASISDTNGFSQTYSYDEQGFVVGKVLSFGAEELYSLALGYDAGGYPTQREDTLDGTATFWSLSYSNNGELESVSSDTTTLESYDYDDNGNRTNLSGEDASYDARDRLINFGSTTYSFDDDGFLTSRTNGSNTDTFSYSARGELLRATVSGEDILFEYDPFGRRIRRTSASQTVTYYYTDPNNAFRISGFLEDGGDFTRVSYDGLGHVVRLDQGASYYYIATDQVGSVRAIFDNAGVLVKSIAYNAIGEIQEDSNTDFLMPLGFGGGIRDAGLVRMGYRDYDPELGRWTATDPILFAGKQANLYVYAANNPVSLVDPMGLICIEASAYEFVGGGAKVCWNDDGWSICAEGGIGFGGSVGITNGALDSTGHTGVAEVSAGCGSLAGVGAGLELTVNPCGDLDATGKGSIEVLGNKFEGKTDGTVEYSAGAGLGIDDAIQSASKLCGASAKLALRGCGQF
ncbi:MAG: hypothetical protein HOI23_07895 [Deltaproteobacteria bacterium]|nr:hypothetical protein [Deltaproteobacteria bacterium]